MARGNGRALGRGDLVKPKHPGGHTMTVMSINPNDRTVLCSYKTPDGVRHDERWQAADLKAVPIA